MGSGRCLLSHAMEKIMDRPRHDSRRPHGMAEGGWRAQRVVPLTSTKFMANVPLIQLAAG